MSLFRPQTPFLQNNAWQNQALNALRYNTSQLGSVLPLIYGTVRQQVNLISLGNYMGPNGGGKKGKGRGALPLGGTNTVQGKGGGGGKKGGGKKGNQDFTVDVAFAMCQGPITFNSANLVFANAQVEAFSATGLHFNGGGDGQAGDPTFNGIGSGINYSGTCWITGTPMDLGTSPTIPNLGFELNGLLYNTGGPNFPVDANPGNVITDFLTNARYGCGFPAANLDDLITPGNSVHNYCAVFGLLISVSLEGQQRAAQWLDGLCRLLNVVPVCSGSLLKFIPRGDLEFSDNDSIYLPNLTPVYALTDEDFLPWHPHQDGADPEVGQDDPIIVTRTNPADAFNWFTIEYLDRANFYNPTPLIVYDQAAIDAYGLRIGDSLPGKCFANAHSAQVSAQLVLQRAQYIRDLYKFQIGWNKALLEVMDIVLLTGSAGDAYLVNEAVRVLQIEENDNGDLTVEAEPVMVGAGSASVATSGGGGGGGGGGLPPAAFHVVNGDWGGWGIGAPQAAAIYPFTYTGIGFGIAPWTVSTTYPSVVIVFIAYGQYDNDGVPYPGYDEDPTIISVAGTNGLTYQRRFATIMYPEYTDHCCNSRLFLEMWWAPAPTALTDELVTCTFSSYTILSTINVAACEGFSAAGVANPWDSNATITGSDWNTDPAGPVVADHMYTGHSYGVLLQAGVLYPMKNFPPMVGYDYSGIGLNVAPFADPGGGGLIGSAPQSFAFASGLKEEGLPAGAMMFQACGVIYNTKLINNAAGDLSLGLGSLYTFFSGPGVWPEWTLLADAIWYH